LLIYTQNTEPFYSLCAAYLGEQILAWLGKNTILLDDNAIDVTKLPGVLQRADNIITLYNKTKKSHKKRRSSKTVSINQIIQPYAQQMITILLHTAMIAIYRTSRQSTELSKMIADSSREMVDQTMQKILSAPTMKTIVNAIRIPDSNRLQQNPFDVLNQLNAPIGEKK
jgi:hypothetical protein